jgi:hypothetical protein
LASGRIDHDLLFNRRGSISWYNHVIGERETGKWRSLNKKSQGYK